MGAYTTRVLQLFDRLDADRSGEISVGDQRKGQTEAEKAVTADLIRHLVTAADANKDGRVSTNELLAYIERAAVGKRVDEMPAYLTATADAVFGLMDTDKSGKVDKAEFEQYLKAHNLNVGAEFSQLDRDGDGSLTKADLRTAMLHFLASPDPAPEQWLLALFTS
ncbi:EF-hand domain-containing protein [Streptomyces sp. BK022]|uniref:EF-hand domain-containing protein n=1 Tax=Streptomyces sp. BK022 TaxID=2512123 RepID=UPI0013EF1703|nr:EF-hand domain-containing protein [Streptomyces sp. BK022]